MKKVLILTRKDDRPTFDQKTTYETALADIATTCDYVVDEFENLLFAYDGTDLKVLLSDGVTDIASFDAVFLIAWFKTKMLEDVALSVSIYLQAKRVKVVNTEALYTRSRSKLSQYVYAALGGVSITPFLFSMNAGTLRRGFAESWQGGYPVIMKGALASRGDDNYLVESRDEAERLSERMNETEGPWFVVQSFVPNDGDYRIIVMGDKVTAVIHRRSQSDSHLNNTSKGGEATWLDPGELPEEVAKQSVTLARLLRREVTGVDMIQHKETGKFYLLEINNMPQMATGSYVTDKIQTLDAYLAEL
ncbi:MAG TPA: hypothetical protein PKD28_03900 [Candidatus Saccharibacteria bacterium]|nr:hypothetical protein [Candidatus Saccharibacteria bacterium]